MHEVFLTRGDFPKSLQHLIWNRCNCALLHPDCHIEAGTKQNQSKIIKSLIKQEGYNNIYSWLEDVDQYVKGTQAQIAIRMLMEENTSESTGI